MGMIKKSKTHKSQKRRKVDAIDESNTKQSKEDINPDELNFAPSSSAFDTQEDFNENFSVEDPEIDEVKSCTQISDLIPVPGAVEFTIPAVTYQDETAYLELKLRQIKFPDISNEPTDFQNELKGDSNITQTEPKQERRQELKPHCWNTDQIRN